MRPRGPVAHALAGMAILALLTGCSSDDDGADVPTREPATAAAAPATTGTPSGAVTRFGPIRALLVESGSGRVVALDPAGATLSVLDAGAAGTPVTIPLPTPATTLVQGADGQVLLPAGAKVLRVDLAAAAVTEIPVEGTAVSVARRADDTLVVGTAEGIVRTLSPTGEVRHSVDGLVSADVLALTPQRVAVLDRRQTSITEITPGADRLGLALRAGDGATSMIADHFGRVMVTDTAGGELLVYTTDPLVLRQRFPVRSSPYALAYDRRSDTVWVSCTQSNEIVGFDLSTGIPREVGRFSTVRQPDSVTVDERTGDLFVGSATGDGLQRIRADERKRGQ
ncbi:YncE family protein [Nocardia takedensis]|uniref:YncE family protein n=1 Tax=Nocardia takedensis TaxID=259390 RepID=UPI000307CE3D|nr:lipoprotein [Nocardia takedensis]